MRVGKAERGGQTAEVLIVGDQIEVVGEWTSGDPVTTPFKVSLFDPGPLENREVLDRSQVRLVPPAGPLTKFICLGLNYRNHVEETFKELAEYPTLFTRLSDSLVGHGEAVLRPSVSTQFDYEGEIAVVIGQPGRHIAPEKAMDHVFGYTIMLDGSVRDYQKHSPTAGKNFWRSGALGPWIVTTDEVADPRELTLETRLNGEQVQHTAANLMLYDIPTAISYVSRWTPLAPGDVIATGTPAGVGARRTPPLWMQPGDHIEVEVSRVGTLRNVVEDEPPLL